MAQPQQPESKDFFLKAEHFFEDNKKIISIAASAILIVVIAIVAVSNFYLPSQEKEAQEQLFKSQMYFERDSFKLALNGDGNYMGFLDIIDEYSWTKAADLSQYYAGISYLRLGQYDQAIEHLEQFDGDDMIVSAMALGAIGDAYTEKGDMEEGISYYKKAARLSRDNFTTPYYLFKAGLALKVEGKQQEALELFKEIKEKYPDSNEGANIEKYIAMLE